MASTDWVHTADNEMPPLHPELEGLLEDLAAVHDEGMDLLIAAARHIALARRTVDKSQTMIAALGGGSDGTNYATVLGHLVARLSDSETNPSLRTLPLEQQKTARLAGEIAFRAFADPDLHQTASNTSAAIDGI